MIFFKSEKLLKSILLIILVMVSVIIPSRGEFSISDLEKSYIMLESLIGDSAADKALDAEILKKYDIYHGYQLLKSKKLHNLRFLGKYSEKKEDEIPQYPFARGHDRKDEYPMSWLAALIQFIFPSPDGNIIAYIGRDKSDYVCSDEFLNNIGNILKIIHDNDKLEGIDYEKLSYSLFMLLQPQSTHKAIYKDMNILDTAEGTTINNHLKRHLKASVKLLGGKIGDFKAAAHIAELSLEEWLAREVENKHSTHSGKGVILSFSRASELIEKQKTFKHKQALIEAKSTEIATLEDKQWIGKGLLKINPSKAKRKPFHVIKILLKAIKECREKDLYDKYLVEHLLLAHFCKKTDDPAKILELQKIMRGITRELAPEITISAASRSSEFIGVYRRIGDSRKREFIERLKKNPAFAMIVGRKGLSINNANLPTLIGYKVTSYKGKRFPDCGASSLLNFFNIMLQQDRKQSRINFLKNILPKSVQVSSLDLRQDLANDSWTPSKKLLWFFSVNSGELVDNDILHVKWASVVNALPNVQYIKSDCEIAAGAKNMLRVIGDLLGNEDLNVIISQDSLFLDEGYNKVIELFKLSEKSRQIPISISKDILNIGVIKFYIGDEVPLFDWNFNSSHFSITRHTSVSDSATTFIDIFKNLISDMDIVNISEIKSYLSTYFTIAPDLCLDILHEKFSSVPEETRLQTFNSLLAYIDMNALKSENLEKYLTIIKEDSDISLINMLSKIPDLNWSSLNFIPNLLKNNSTNHRLWSLFIDIGDRITETDRSKLDEIIGLNAHLPIFWSDFRAIKVNINTIHTLMLLKPKTDRPVHLNGEWQERFQDLQGPHHYSYNYLDVAGPMTNDLAWVEEKIKAFGETFLPSTINPMFRIINPVIARCTPSTIKGMHTYMDEEILNHISKRIEHWTGPKLRIILARRSFTIEKVRLISPTIEKWTVEKVRAIKSVSAVSSGIQIFLMEVLAPKIEQFTAKQIRNIPTLIEHYEGKGYFENNMPYFQSSIPEVKAKIIDERKKQFIIALSEDIDFWNLENIYTVYSINVKRSQIRSQNPNFHKYRYKDACI